MPENEREFRVDASPEETWAHLTDMEKFAQHLPNFQDFEQVDEDTSLWTLKVDVSKFTREMTVEVEVTEEQYPRGAFDFDPQGQPGTGSGSVVLEEDDDGGTLIQFILEAEATGRMSPFLNKVIGQSLPWISNNLIESIQETDIEDSVSLEQASSKQQ